MRTTTNIPVPLCEYALVNRKVNQLKLYLYLKLQSDGYMPFNEENFRAWSKEIGVHVKTIKSSLKWLVKNKWITVNSKRQVLHITSYKRVASILQVKISTGVLVDLTTCEDYGYFEALCCGIVITEYIRKKRNSEWRSERKKGSFITNRCRVKGFYPIANGYVAKCLKVSIATAYRIKQKAEEAGFIETQKNYSYLKTVAGSKVGADSFYAIRHASLMEGEPDYFRKGRRYVKRVDATLIKSTLTCKRKA